MDPISADQQVEEDVQPFAPIVDLRPWAPPMIDYSQGVPTYNESSEEEAGTELVAYPIARSNDPRVFVVG